MTRARMSGPIALVAVASWVLPAHAAPQDCAEIAAAFDRLGQVPAFRQSIVQDGISLEATAIGDTLYMVMDGDVTELPLEEGGRAQMFAAIFDTLTVTDCTALPDESLEGRPMRVFEYVLPPNPPFVPEALMQRVWIGGEDGLPYRATNPTGEVTIRYDGVEAPAQ